MKAAVMLVTEVLLIGGAVASIAVTPELPPLTGPVVDSAGVIDADDARNIAALARELKTKTGA